MWRPLEIVDAMVPRSMLLGLIVRLQVKVDPSTEINKESAAGRATVSQSMDDMNETVVRALTDKIVTQRKAEIGELACAKERHRRI